MRPFVYERADDPLTAVRATAGSRRPPTAAPAQLLAGGTSLYDLMKLEVQNPETVVDINGLPSRVSAIRTTPEGLTLGALARMSTVADDPAVVRDYPVIAQSLQLAASAQLRNMASLGGNVLQRTRCTYFRDASWARCNKRDPGSGCAALTGVNRKHAVLGVSERCIAEYPGDFAQALIALDAQVTIQGPVGERRIPFAGLHHSSGESPEVETVLEPGDLITSFFVPAGPWTRRSLYLKVRDRQSYAFADARPRPWRCRWKAGRCARCASDSAAWPENPGEPATQRRCSRARRSTKRRRRPPRPRRSQAQSPTAATRPSRNSAAGRWSARSCKPRRWRPRPWLKARPSAALMARLFSLRASASPPRASTVGRR